LRLVYGQDARVARWVIQHAPHADAFDKYVAIGVEDGNELVAGFVFNEYRGHSIAISMASTTPKWCSRSTMAAAFGYAFLQLKCKRLTAYTGLSMANVRVFLERLGFVQEGVIRAGFADDDAVVYGMLREECRFLPRTFHEERPRTAARA
jgi:RimJ/RimL family protein N-acetyltransferase